MLGEAATNLEKFVVVRNCDRKFSPAVIKQATEVLLTPMDLSKRTESTGFTIDPRGAHSFDDAIWIEDFPKDGNLQNFLKDEKTKPTHLIKVSIADVASFIPIDSPLDQEAFRRGSSKFNEPMLPSMLSSGRFSLEKGLLRPTITFTIPVDKEFRTGKLHIQKTFMRSLETFSYEDVELSLRNGDPYEFRKYLRIGREVISARGIVADPNSEEYAFYSGRGSKQNSETHDATLIVANLMVLINKELAKYFNKRGIPFIYRNHLESLNRGAADYGPYCLGHDGLDLPGYAHVTSPIRRYSDLVNQRLILAHLNNEHPPYDIPELDKLCLHLHWSCETTNGKGKSKNGKHGNVIYQK